MEALLALVVMTSIDHQPWRWLLGLSALPMLIVIPLFVVSDRKCDWLYENSPMLGYFTYIATQIAIKCYITASY